MERVFSASEIADLRTGAVSLATWQDDVRNLCDSHEALRDLLRRVVSQQCVKVYEDDSSEGEIVPVIDAIEDTLRAAVDAALEVAE